VRPDEVPQQDLLLLERLLARRTLAAVRVEAARQSRPEVEVDEVAAEIEPGVVTVVADPALRKLLVLFLLTLARLRNLRPPVLRRQAALKTSTPVGGFGLGFGQNFRVDETHVDVEQLRRLVGQLDDEGRVVGAEMAEQSDPFRRNEATLRALEGVRLRQGPVEEVLEVENEMFREVEVILVVRRTVLAVDERLQSADGFLPAGLHLFLQIDGVHAQAETGKTSGCVFTSLHFKPCLHWRSLER